MLAMTKPAPPRVSIPLAYRSGEANYCPGCGRTNWIIGRTSAECGFCSTAIPLADGLNERRFRTRARIIRRGEGGGKVS